MKVFISWSGEKARKVAIALRTFLQDVNQRIDPWFSDSEIVAGQRWAHELANQLEDTGFGIVCITSESLGRPWVLFEAGALSKSVAGGRVCPYLIDVRPSELDGPLSQFQSKDCTRDHTWELLTAINLAMDSGALPDSRLSKYFEVHWPLLASEIEVANRKLQAPPPPLIVALLDVLPRVFYLNSQIERIAQIVGLPLWLVNFNQAAIYVWREIVQVATAERALSQLIEYIMTAYPGLENSLQEPRRLAEEWSTHLNPKDEPARWLSRDPSSSLFKSPFIQFSDPRASQLREILMSRYWNKDEVEMFLDLNDLQLDVDLVGPMSEVWVRVLSEAARKGVLRKLVELARDALQSEPRSRLQEMLDSDPV